MDKNIKIQKLQKDLMLTLDEDMIKHLGVKEGDELSLKIKNGGIEIKKVN